MHSPYRQRHILKLMYYPSVHVDILIYLYIYYNVANQDIVKEHIRFGVWWNMTMLPR